MIVDMSQKRYSDQQKAQCVIWLSKDHEGQQFKGYFARSILCRVDQDVRLIFHSKTIATLKLILTWGRMRCPQSVKRRENRSNKGSTPALDVLCGKVQSLLRFIKRLCGFICTRSLRYSRITCGLDHTYQMQIGKTGSILLIFVRKRWTGTLTFLKEFLSSMSTVYCWGAENNKNYTFWGTQRLNTAYEWPQRTQSLMVWCVTSKIEVIGPNVFYDHTVTEDRYGEMLQYYLFSKAARNPSDMIFQ